MGKDMMGKEVMITVGIVVGNIEVRKGAVLKIRGVEGEGDNMKYNLHGITYRMNARIEVDISVESDCFEVLYEESWKISSHSKE